MRTKCKKHCENRHNTKEDIIFIRRVITITRLVGSSKDCWHHHKVRSSGQRHNLTEATQLNVVYMSPGEHQRQYDIILSGILSDIPQ